MSHYYASGEADGVNYEQQESALPPMHGPSDLRRPLVGAAAIKRFVFAGNATFTLVSKRTGERRTFRVRAAPPSAAFPMGGGFFASLLAGSDNTGDYKYLAFVTEQENYSRAVGLASYLGRTYRVKPNRQGWGADATKVLAWFLDVLARGSDEKLAQVEVWHEGRCGKCGRALTVPESIASGIGPVCEGKG